jgi:hypothetical protein
MPRASTKFSLAATGEKTTEELSKPSERSKAGDEVINENDRLKTTI